MGRPSGRGQPDLGVHDRPGEAALEVGLDVRKPELEAEFCLGLDVVLDQVTEPQVLTPPSK
jgi:hypothetical protein